jgi:hypothetical protein
MNDEGAEAALCQSCIPSVELSILSMMPLLIRRPKSFISHLSSFLGPHQIVA